MYEDVSLNALFYLEKKKSNSWFFALYLTNANLVPWMPTNVPNTHLLHCTAAGVHYQILLLRYKIKRQLYISDLTSHLQLVSLEDVLDEKHLCYFRYLPPIKATQQK